MSEGNRIIIHPHQRLALLCMAISALVASIYMAFSLSIIVFYSSIVIMVISLFVFTLPLAFSRGARRVQMKAGQHIFEFMNKAGLTEEDMRAVLRWAKDGYKVGFSQSDEQPYYQVMLTVQKFERKEQPREEDYWPWEDAVKHLEEEEVDVYED